MWGRLAAYVGVPSVIAIFLVWNLTSNVNARLDGQQAELKAMSLALSAVAKHMDSDGVQMWMLVAAAQRTCLNTSKTDLDRIACISTPGSR